MCVLLWLANVLTLCQWITLNLHHNYSYLGMDTVQWCTAIGKLTLCVFFVLQVKQIEKRDSVLTPKQQIERLLRPGSSYFNLNPFEVNCWWLIYIFQLNVVVFPCIVVTFNWCCHIQPKWCIQMHSCHCLSSDIDTWLVFLLGYWSRLIYNSQHCKLITLKVLQIDPDVTDDEIKKRFRQVGPSSECFF